MSTQSGKPGTMEALKKTGRTHRMLLHALELERGGHHVCIVCSRRSEVDPMAREFARLKGSTCVLRKIPIGMRIDDRVIVTSCTNQDWSWDIWRVAGLCQDTIYLVDHLAIESTYPKFVQELHRFDVQK